MIGAARNDDAGAARQVELLQIATLFGQAPLQVMATAIVVPAVWLVMRTAADPLVVTVWAAAQLGASALLILLWRLHALATSEAQRLKFGRAYVGGSLLYGLALGLGCFAMFVPGRVDYQMFLAAILGTMCGTATGTHSVYRPVCIAFIGSALLPFAARLYLDGGELQLLLAIVAVAAAGAFLYATMHFSRRLAAGFRLQIENARLASEMQATQERLNLALESIADAFVMFDSSDRLVLANRKYRDMLLLAGLDIGEGEHSYADVIGAIVKSGPITATSGLADFSSPRLDEWRRQKEPVEMQSRDGRWVQLTTRTTAAGDLVALVTDITGVRGRAARLASSEQRLRSIMDNVVDGILTTDDAGRIESANRVVETLLGHAAAELEGRSLDLVLPAAAAPGFLAGLAARDRGRGGREFVARRRDGTELPVEINVGETRIDGARKFVAMLRDIRERKAQQAQLTQSSKLASLGEIATGLAHELNQPLNIIRMAADSSLILMADGMADADFQRSQLGLISGQTVRMAKIIEHMRVFGRKDNADAVPFSPADSARSALSLVQQQFRVADIDLAVDLPADCRAVLGYPLRLEQVLLNLLNNARDAVQGGPARGRIGIAIRDDRTAADVVVEVSDNGGGVPAEMLDRVFDPFFTTKEAGKGTGLGLSISYAIIGDMGGRLAVRNGPEGAIFSVTLPAHRENEKGLAPPAP